MKIRNATYSDLKTVAEIEAACFPPEEAATEQSFQDRLRVYPNFFWLLEIDGKVVSFIDGLVTNEETIRDEMFSDTSLHNENGAYQTLLGVNTLPSFRRNGYAEMLIKSMLSDAKEQGRRGCILTCKEQLLSYYSKFGFINEGVSKSVHGGAVWYDMRLMF